MSPTEAVNKVKMHLLEVVEAMNDAAKLGVKIEFNIVTDPVSYQAQLARFIAFQEMKVNQ
jgi:hypothetical protein